VCYRVYDRADHVSTAMLQSELDQLQSMAGVIPVLFLLVAAVILYISLFRLVEQQRAQIGALLSLGFSHRAISIHFACFGAVTGLLGGVAGGATGILGAVPIWEYYLTFYSMPSLGAGFGAAYPYLFYSALAGGLFCGAIGWLAARGVARLQPAEALQPAAPPAGKLTPLERLPWMRELLTIPGLVGLRGVFRNGRRSLFSLLGIACAYMMIASLVSMNSMMDIFVYDELTVVEQQDFTVYFNAPVSWADARSAVSHPEVRRTELVLDVGVTCKSPVASLSGTLKGLEPGGELLRIADAAGRLLALEEGGAVITAHLAAALDLGPGDWLEVESPGPAGRTMRLPVTGVTGQYMNVTVYVPLRLAAEFQRTNGACNSLLVAGTEQARRDVADRLADAARFTLAEGRLAKIDKINAAMGSMLFILYYMAFAGVAIGFAVIFTGSLVCFEEMKREMATMITLGLNSRDCLEVISSGQWLLTFGGVILGLPLTWAATEAIVRTMSGDMYTIPNYLSGEALARAAVLTLIAVVLSNAVIHRRLRRITPVDIMRERN
ncbi:MAG: FtsX-like permease family protein, partial [Gracilibacteraceae bacterium]|nr:FtsX-like permease family protein [Gracilibacteraceae bacterium]